MLQLQDNKMMWIFLYCLPSNQNHWTIATQKFHGYTSLTSYINKPNITNPNLFFNLHLPFDPSISLRPHFLEATITSRGGHFHIMELRIRVNKNVEKGSDFCHRASSTFLEIRGQFSTTSTLRVSILNNEHRHLGSYFRPIRCCFRSPDFLGTDGRHLGMACRLLRYIVMIKRVTLVCERDLRWKRLWYESEKLRGQLANFRRQSCPIDFHTVYVFTSAIKLKGRYFNRIYGQIWQIYR